MPARRRPLAILRSGWRLLCLLPLLLSALIAPSAVWAGSLPAAAGGQQASAFAQGPAGSEQLALYARIASVNTCIATRAGQEFEQAAGVAGETIAQLILGVHQGLIASSGSTPLSLEELRRGSINAAVIGATEICPKQVPAELSAKVKQALAYENQSGASGG